MPADPGLPVTEPMPWDELVEMHPFLGDLTGSLSDDAREDLYEISQGGYLRRVRRET
jgi:hypothetical protein